MTNGRIDERDGRPSPQENVLEGLDKMKLQGSEQFQIVLAVNNQELNRDEERRALKKLRTMVIDQMTRTRKSKPRSERIGTGVVVNSQQGRKVSVDKKAGERFQWKATGQCSKGNSKRHNHGSPFWVKEHNHPLLLRERRTRLTEESLAEMAVQDLHLNEHMVTSVTHCRHTEAGASNPMKNSKKNGGKNRWLYRKKLFNFVVCPEIVLRGHSAEKRKITLKSPSPTAPKPRCVP